MEQGGLTGSEEALDGSKEALAGSEEAFMVTVCPFAGSPFAGSPFTGRRKKKMCY